MGRIGIARDFGMRKVSSGTPWGSAAEATEAAYRAGEVEMLCCCVGVSNH